MNINVKKNNDKAKIPTRGSEFSAGSDLYACLENGVSELGISPGETVLIHTGLVLELPCGYAGMIFGRSGLATKRGLAPANKVGVVDSDYRGEIMVALHNHSNQVQTISDGERIAQLVVMPFLPVVFNLVDEVTETERGANGFGSTGKN